MERKKVVKIDLNNKLYGGRVYENLICDLLEDEIEFKRVFLLKHPIKIFNIPRIVWLFIRYRYFYSGTLLLTNHTTWFAGLRAKNIAVIHHIDNTVSSIPKLNELFQWLCNKALLYNKKRWSKIITVAECWKDALADMGLRNIHVIYNSFDVDSYKIPASKVAEFRQKHGWSDKPLIYLGNCQKKKGVVEVYNVLKDMDVHMVTSGNRDVVLPIPNLYLSYDEYRLLLAASDLVLTMSLFREGWNRTAHEAVLCGTPVIGTGTGGMMELLTMSRQTVCTSFVELPRIVASKLSEHEEVGDTLSAFNLNYFREEWSRIFAES